MFLDYIRRVHKERIRQYSLSVAPHEHRGIPIRFLELFQEDQQLATLLLKKPDEALQLCDKQIDLVQDEVIAEIRGSKNPPPNSERIPKIGIHARIYDLPNCPEITRNVFPLTDDEPRYLQITGTVVRVSAMDLLESQREYTCAACRMKVIVKASYDHHYEIIPPRRCTQEFCNCTLLTARGLDSESCRDYQEIKMQEDINVVAPGTMPKTLIVTLEDDIADRCKPGDSLTVCGSLRRRWRSVKPGQRLKPELVLKGNHIQANNDASTTAVVSAEMENEFAAFWRTHADDELVGRDIILRSFAPQIHGLQLAKLAVAVVLAGGSLFSAKTTADNAIRTRTTPHLLLIGDPGTGKSQLLRQAAKILPRSVMTTGIGTTAAGLTVSSFMENGEWTMEAGALLLADGGICCIDEFNSMKENDRMSLHEAMEQQSISVAKAALRGTLHTRCSLLAAANPKGPLDLSQPLSYNIALPSSLLSRFDLILLLKDRRDPNRDKQVVEHISRASQIKSAWSLEMLRAYYVKIKRINPILTTESRRVLSAYYQHQRQNQDVNRGRTTVRLLDSLIRLSQAHARLMCHEAVSIVDVVMAIILVGSSMSPDASDVGEAAASVDVLADFPNNPAQQYRKYALDIFQRLKLDFDEFIAMEKNSLRELALKKEAESQPAAQSSEARFNLNEIKRQRLETPREMPVDDVEDENANPPTSTSEEQSDSPDRFDDETRLESQMFDIELNDDDYEASGSGQPPQDSCNLTRTKAPEVPAVNYVQHKWQLPVYKPLPIERRVRTRTYGFSEHGNDPDAPVPATSDDEGASSSRSPPKSRKSLFDDDVKDEDYSL